MLKHNILFFFRNIKRQKNTFLINIIGLSTGLACTLLIVLWVVDEMNVDKFHANHERIYQVIEHLEFTDGIKTITETSSPMAELLKDEMPEVEYATATIPPSWFGDHVLSVGENNLKAKGQLVGEDYFRIFSFGLIEGDKNNVMSDPNSIVISKALAINLFGSAKNVVGKTIEFEKKRQFQVSGVFEDVPTNSTVQFDFVLSTEASKEETPWNSLNTWNSSGPRVYVSLKEETDISALNAKVGMIRKNRNENTIRTATLVPFSENYLYGTYENGKQVGGRIKYVHLFSIIALIILTIACINFMNLSTARASKRLKEIGVKKAVGAKRKVFVLQFLGESVLMVFMALSIALVMVAVFLPQFNIIIAKQLTLTFNATLILIILCITVFTGLVAGSYPAFYLSNLNAVAILKGKWKSSIGELWTRKGLVITQFTLSVVLIVSVLVVYKQVEFVQNQNLGYNQDNIVQFKIEGKIKDQLQAFVSEVKKLPGIKNASSTTHSMVGHNWSTTLNWEGKESNNVTQFQIVGVDYGLIETLGMEMAMGRSFSREFGTDSTSIIFNETAIKAMGIEDPIGKMIGDRTIIGMVKDFHFKSLHDKVEPLFMSLMPEGVNKVMARIEAGKEKEALNELQAFYETFNPGFPFEYQFLDRNYQALYTSEKRVATLSKYFAGMAILISCLGLFGLAIFTAERRQKEISVRRVLGQSASQVTIMLSREFAELVLLSIVIALPISYFLTQNWLASFAYSIPLQVWYFLGAGLIALLVAILTVGIQAIQAANKPPVNALREG